MPWFTFRVRTMPWNFIPYDELKKYFKIEFALRYRYVDEEGKYDGFTMSETKYRARACAS